MRWRIVYTDGSSFSDEDGDPAAAPGGGVVAIAQQDPVVGYEVHDLADFYVWDRVELGGWKGMDVYGFTDYLLRANHAVTVKLGRYTDTKIYVELTKKLRQDGLTKSARQPWERPTIPGEEV